MVLGSSLSLFLGFSHRCLHPFPAICSIHFFFFLNLWRGRLAHAFLAACNTFPLSTHRYLLNATSQVSWRALPDLPCGLSEAAVPHSGFSVSWHSHIALWFPHHLSSRLAWALWRESDIHLPAASAAPGTVSETQEALKLQLDEARAGGQLSSYVDAEEHCGSHLAPAGSATSCSSHQLPA